MSTTFATTKSSSGAGSSLLVDTQEQFLEPQEDTRAFVNKRHSRSLDLPDAMRKMAASSSNTMMVPSATPPLPSSTTSSSSNTMKHQRSASERDLKNHLKKAAVNAPQTPINGIASSPTSTRTTPPLPVNSSPTDSTHNIFKSYRKKLARTSIGSAFSINFNIKQQNNAHSAVGVINEKEEPKQQQQQQYKQQQQQQQQQQQPQLLQEQKKNNDAVAAVAAMASSTATTAEKRSLPSNLKEDINQFAIDGFAKKYFATHKKGLLLFKRTIPRNELLCWTKDTLKQPLLIINPTTAASSSSSHKKDALKCFKIIQMLMKDRPRPRQFNMVTCCQELLNYGITKGQLRDEIYVQICRQLNHNPRKESRRLGWEILCVICISFPPSKNLESYLYRFVEQQQQQRHENSNTKDEGSNSKEDDNDIAILTEYVHQKLKRICERGARGKVLTEAEIKRAMIAPFKPSVFGESLETIMDLEQQSQDIKIPRIVQFLTDSVYEFNGIMTEGIFRIPGDADAVTDLRIRIENGHYDATGIHDPHVPASLLKFWLRDLAEPLIPSEYYHDCIEYSQDKHKLLDLVNSLPEINRRITLYMIRFLQDFAEPEIIEKTRMNVFNLAMVFAPNFLRCPSANLTTIFENSKYEQAFLKTLITVLEIDKQQCLYSSNEVHAKLKK